MSTGHRIKEYLKYRRKARTRHGVHSPFVYAFIENILRTKGKISSKLVLVTGHHKKLVNKLVAFFKCRYILWITNREGEQETFITIAQNGNSELQLKSERYEFESMTRYPTPDLVLVDLAEPEQSLQAVEKYLPFLRSESIVLVTAIHRSNAHTAAWADICSLPQVLLSIDLFRVGLLFFREEFKEKQHFILKYKG